MVVSKSVKPERRKTHRPEPSTRATPRRPPGPSHGGGVSGRPPATSASPRKPAPSDDDSDDHIEIVVTTAEPGGRAGSARPPRQRVPSAAPPRKALSTLGYEERAPAVPPRPRVSSSPELIAISETAVGRLTHAAIQEDILAESLRLAETLAEAKNRRTEAVMPAVRPDLYEIRTFVVSDIPAALGTSDEARRAFVEEHLLYRLPALSMKEVARIDVTPGAAKGSAVLRVWCTVPERPT